MGRVLIQNADWILTMDEARRKLAHADVLLEGGGILAVGPKLDPGPGPVQRLDATGRIVIPGIIDTHHHCAVTIIRDLENTTGLNLMPWLYAIYSALACFDRETMYTSALGALGNLLKSGCTTVADHHYAYPKQFECFADLDIQAARELGIRFQFMRGCVSMGKQEGCDHVPDALVEDTERFVSECRRLIAQYHDPRSGAMCRVGIAPCWPVYEKPSLMARMRDLQEQHQVLFHGHLSDVRQEYSDCQARFGCTPVQYMQRLGLLNSHSYFAHCVQLSNQDLALLAKSRAGVSHCASTDLLFNTGVCKVPELLRRGVRVSLGMDCAVCNHSSSVFAELTNSFLIQRVTWHEKALSLEQMLELATVGGAAVLGRSDIGSIAPGKQADLVLLNWDQFQYAGAKYEPIAGLLLSGDARMVETVLVAGQLVVQNGKLTQIDEDAMKRRINDASDALFHRMQQR